MVDALTGTLSWLLHFLERHHDAFAAVQSVATAFAFAAGGYWALLTARRRRVRFPRASLDHSISAWQVANGRWIIHVVINLTNVSEVLLCLKEGRAWVQQVDPCAENVLQALQLGDNPIQGQSTEVEWPRIGDVRSFIFDMPEEIEPGESDEYHADFFADAPIHRVLVYTHFSNVAKRRRFSFSKSEPIGWKKSTFYDLPDTRIECQTETN